MSAELRADDAAFVRASSSLVYRRIAALEAWPGWWPDLRLRTRPVPPADLGTATEAWNVELRVRLARRLRYGLTPFGWRHERGFRFSLTGDLVGHGELWLDPTQGGTVVHHLLTVRTPLPHPERILRDHRRGVRRGLWGLKDVLQHEVRTSIGLPP